MGSCKNYVDKCFKSGAMDFDDLLLKTNELLNRFPKFWANIKIGSDIF
jgi:DNA helicase-2/ATP-dependent DNA helicase PcrA